MTVYQQGEVRIEEIDKLPDGLRPFSEKTDNGNSYIISHSETGNHHVLDCADCEVMERPLPPEFGEGMRILYAIVNKPTEMYIDGQSNHHKPQKMDGKFYELTISIETDPFTKQARRVAD